MSENEEIIDTNDFVLTTQESESLYLVWTCFGVNFNSFLDMSDEVRSGLSILAVKIWNQPKFRRTVF